VKVVATLLGDAVLIEVAPESPRGVSFIIAADDLRDDSWKEPPHGP
jgi:hypothetical protein